MEVSQSGGTKMQFKEGAAGAIIAGVVVMVAAIAALIIGRFPPSACLIAGLIGAGLIAFAKRELIILDRSSGKGTVETSRLVGGTKVRDFDLKEVREVRVDREMRFSSDPKRRTSESVFVAVGLGGGGRIILARVARRRASELARAAAAFLGVPFSDLPTVSPMRSSVRSRTASESMITTLGKIASDAIKHQKLQ